MEIIPVQFRFERWGVLPILTVIGMTTYMPGIEAALITNSLEIIRKTAKYNGSLTGPTGHENLRNLRNGMIAISFNILFETEKDYANAISSIKKELG